MTDHRMTFNPDFHQSVTLIVFAIQFLLGAATGYLYAMRRK